MKKLLHIIESLGVGGAEQLVVGIINGLEGYEHHLIILNEPADLRSSIIRDHSYLNLNFSKKIDLLRCAKKVKQYIRNNKIDIVHAHLYWANIISRLGVPKEIPVYNSIHAISSQAAYKVNRLTLHIEKLTYRKRHHIVAVSREVLNDFDKHIGLRGKATVLYNFVDEKFFSDSPKRNFSKDRLKLVAVGNLRQQKNYPYLLEALKKVKPWVTLDIYGEGPMRTELQEQIDKAGLPVSLCGLTYQLPRLLPQYDAFVMSSFYEGQPLSLLEAMAAGLPAILADIPVLREVTGKDALYFDINSTDSFHAVIQSILVGKADLNALSEASHKKVNAFAHRQQYFVRLNELYDA
jgi:L-malate glycosyltransferase